MVDLPAALPTAFLTEKLKSRRPKSEVCATLPVYRIPSYSSYRVISNTRP
jgi:hypothetical protein